MVFLRRFFMKLCRALTYLTLFAATVMISSCSKDNNAVNLAVDFTKAEVWKYDFSCTISGSFDWPDSSSILSSKLDCILIGHKIPGTESGELEVSADSVRVSSGFLDTAELVNIRRQVALSHLNMRFNGKIPIPADTVSLPMFGLGEWDIYRQLIKVAPTLPMGRVRPGYAWERERQMPLETSFGKADCSLYQSFRFDSLFHEGKSRYAALSWRFKYNVSPPKGDSSGITNKLPQSGNGHGHAVLDVDGSRILSAEIDFITPQAAFKDMNVRWEEHIRMMLADK